MKTYKIILFVLGTILPISTILASWSAPFYKLQSPEHYYKIQYGYSGSTEEIKKWATDNSYFLTLKLEDYSDEKLHKEYLLNYRLEGEIRKMLSFLENEQIDKIDALFEDNMLRVLNILHKSENGYLPNEEQFIDYFIKNKSQILKQLYLDLLHRSRALGYPINKDSGNVWEGEWKEPFYMDGKLPYDIYLENRKFSDYYYDYKIYFHTAILIFIGIFVTFLIRIISKSRKHRHTKSNEITTDDLDHKGTDTWESFSKGDKIVLYIFALIIPPLCIGLLSIPFLEEPIIIKNPWVDSVFFFGLIKLYYTKKYNHIITSGLVIMLLWHLMINILFFS